MVAGAPTRADLGTMIRVRMTPRGERSIHQQVKPLILEEGLSKGTYGLGLDEIPREWKRLRRESRFMEG